MGDLIVIERVAWDWFVSVTVARRDASDKSLFSLTFALYRAICKRQGLVLRALPIGQRIESGSDPAHRHVHFLIGGLRKVGTAERMWLIWYFNRLVGYRENSLGKIPNGTIRCRLYRAGGGAAAYLLKDLNASEAGGFAGSELWLSNAAARCMASRSARAGQRMAKSA